MEEDDSLFKSFATSTTAHGFSRLAEAQNFVRKVIWSVLLIAAFVGVVTVLGFRLKMFLEFRTIIESDMKVEESLQFPSVTICNHNPLSMSKVLTRFLTSFQLSDDSPHFSIGAFDQDPQLLYYKRLCDAVECTESKIKCAMGDGDCCLSKDRVCDGYTDCMDQRDEGAICPGQSTYNLINTTHNLLNITPWYSDENCYNAMTAGRDYAGTRSQTIDGTPCQRWDSQNDPHSIQIFADDRFPDESISDASNYCRNPDMEPGPWCYTTDPLIRWQLCDIPQCGSVTGQTPGNNSTNTPAGISATNNLFLLTDDGSRINWTTEQGVGGHGNKSSTSLSAEKNEKALLDDRFGTESSIMGRNTTTSSATTTNFVNDSVDQPMVGPPVGHSKKRSRDRWQWADTTTPLPLWTTPSGTENTDLISKLMDDGWHLTDRNTADERGSATLLDCRFAGVMCDSTWFHQLLTDKGACYTFNHPQNSLADGVHTPLRQSNGGPAYGLRLVLDAQVADYITNVYTNMLKGLTISVHGNDVKPNMKDTGMNVPVGFHTNIAISKSQMLNIERPWGKCDQNDELELLPNMTYSYQSCTQECMAKEVIRACHCKPYYTETEDQSIEVCSQDKWTYCGIPAYDATTANFSAVCSYCNPACNETKFETKTSQSQIVTTTADWVALNNKYYKSGIEGEHSTNPNFYSESVVSMTIYFEDLQLTTISQKKQIDELGLISEFGGMLGLFMGLSLLTLVEILETIVMGCYKCHLRRSYGASSTSF